MTSSNIAPEAADDAPGDVEGLASFVLPVAIRAAATLRIPDQLAAGPCSSADLAERAGLARGPLQQLLRALVAGGILSSPASDTYDLTDAGALLVSDHPFSLRDSYQLSALELAAWGHLDHSLRTGRAAFEHAFGVSHRSFRDRHPAEDERMDRAQRAATRIDALSLVHQYDWSPVRWLVDVGGGTGALVAALLARFKSMRATLFDLPRMVAGAKDVVAGVADRVQVVGGDFFESVPAAADVYVLKAVLGGWSDDAAGQILHTIRRAMRDDSVLLVIEPILGYGPGFTMGNIVHLQSLVLYGGPDRTKEAYDALFEASALALRRIVPRPTLPILEIIPT